MRERSAACASPAARLAAALGLLLAGACGAAEDASRAPAGDVPASWTREFPKADFSRRTVDLGEIRAGGPPRDGIPAIDHPRFAAPDRARDWLRDDEPVIVLRLGGAVRAYPLQILMFHEIVNDTMAGVPVAVTFCPLCNASLAFERTVEGTVLDFGTTGRLRHSDLVMYDRQTESWWQQFTGKGIVGRHAGTQLRELPSQITAFADFAAAYPDGEVLSRDTGFDRPYGRNPYRGYDRIGDNPFLFDGAVDARLPAMERVIAVSLGGRHRVHPFRLLDRQPVINDAFEGVPYVVFSREGLRSALDAAEIARSRTVPAATAFERRLDGRVLSFARAGEHIVDEQTGSRWNLFGEAVDGALKGRALAPVPGGVHFAFAWLAFRPDSEIYRAR